MNSLYFADDLILLYKANKQSFESMLNGLNLFLGATGLSINYNKSCSYVCGVLDEMKHDLINLAGFTGGSFPLTYLGVQVKPTKWTKCDCARGADKIRRMITNWVSRHLSVNFFMLYLELGPTGCLFCVFLILYKRKMHNVAWTNICRP